MRLVKRFVYLCFFVIFLTGCAGAYGPPVFEDEVQENYISARYAVERAGESEAPQLAGDEYEMAFSNFIEARQEMEKFPTDETVEAFKTTRNLANEATITALQSQLAAKDKQIEKLQQRPPETTVKTGGWEWNNLQAEYFLQKEQKISDTTFYRLDLHIQFDTGAVEIAPAHRQQLKKAAETGKQLENHYLLVVGSTDELPMRPEDEYESNRKLAMARASNAATVLIWGYDLPRKNVGLLSLAEYGKFRPRFAELSHSEKRRVEFWFVPLKFLEGMPEK